MNIKITELKHLIDVRLGALQRLALVWQACRAVEIGHLAAGRVDAEVAVVARATVQIQAQVVTLARGDSVRKFHHPGRMFETRFGGLGHELGDVVTVNIQAARLLLYAEAKLSR